MKASPPPCYVCDLSDCVVPLGVASVPMPPTGRSVSISYIDAGLVSVGLLPLTTTRVASTIYACRRCDLIWRPLSEPAVVARLDEMVHVRPELEEAWSRQRGLYFRREFSGLRRLVQWRSDLPITFLDIGCSYGHLLDIAHEAGWRVAGVDGSKKLVERLSPRKPYPLFHLVLPQDRLPFPDSSFDLITFYDSFYMLEDPLAVLNDAYDKLKDGGYLSVRLANRNRYVRVWLLIQSLLSRFRPRSDVDAMAILGDQKYSYSPTSFRCLVKRSKFAGAVVRIRVLERGKRGISPLTRFMYVAGSLLSWGLLMRVILAPAFTAVVRKESP